jgi:protein arginine kinase
VELSDLLHGNGEWLRGAGPENDVIISSRIRLARNLAAYPFVSRASSSDRERIAERIQESIADAFEDDDLLQLPIEELGEIDRLVLVERHLISRELVDTEGARAVAFDSSEAFSLMINEEDHLRIQVMRAGFDLEGVWTQTN